MSSADILRLSTPNRSTASLNGLRNAPASGGYAPSDQINQNDVEVVFIDPLDRKYECPVCDQVVRYPVQFEECSHRCCSSCLPELLRVAPRCPIDQIPISRERVYVDKSFQKEVDNLGVRCSFFQKGCGWSGILTELTGHLEQCVHRLVVCPLKCGVEFEIRFLDKHCAEDCQRRMIKCQFCEADLMALTESDHLSVCGKFPIPCPNGCKRSEVLREQMAEHLETVCIKQEQTCPFAEYGCEFRGLKRKVREHINADLAEHLRLICEAVKESGRIVDEQVKAITEHQTMMTLNERRISSLEKLYGPQLLWKIDNFASKFNEAKSGKKTTIFSPPFFTSRFGYRMALSACLYGDGKAKSTHISLFICLCRGDYDALLTWPFSHRVTLTLIDQCQDPDARKNISYLIKPNISKENTPFLGRPTGERNPSFGAQKFVDHEVIKTLDYIRDDTIFIKVVIDSFDIVAV